MLDIIDIKYVLGCAVPPQTTASKEQNDAFHTSWHITNLNTLDSP
jgi:hypothetical protein